MTDSQALIVMLNALRLEIRSASLSHTLIEGIKARVTDDAQVTALTEQGKALLSQADTLARIAQGEAR